MNTTVEQPMTKSQAAYLKTLTKVLGEEFDPKLTKAQASREISRLKEQRDKAMAQAS